MKTFNVSPDLTIDQNDQVNAGKEIQFYTTAPKEYDWGWTKELNADTGYRNKKKEVFRFIVVADKYHADMQKGRYHSGLYECLEVHEFTVYEDKERETKSYRVQETITFTGKIEAECEADAANEFMRRMHGAITQDARSHDLLEHSQGINILDEKFEVWEKY